MKRLGGIERVRVLAVVDEELAAVLVARVAVALDELVALERLAVAHAAELHLPGRHVLHVVAGGIDRPPRLEHQRRQAALAELLGGPAAGDAGADDNRVEAGRGHQKSPGPARQPPNGPQPSYAPGIVS